MSSGAGKKRSRWESSSEEEEDSDNDDIEEEKIERKKDAKKQVSSDGVDKSKLSPPSSSIPATTDGKVENANGDNEASNIETAKKDSSAPHGIEAATPELAKHNPLLYGCRSVYDCYERLDRLDEGTYGVVWKAKDVATDEIVALKQIKFESALLKEGFPVTALREIGVLLALQHECIVSVREMVVGKGFDKVFMVMEYMEMDLQEAMKRSGPSPFPQSELKNMLYQILSGIHHIHDKWYLHRDLKTSNILVHKSGKVALCDFGLARKYQMPLRPLTQMVITLWYRPPELLFGEHVYGPEVDMWSVGCIFGELLTKEAMLQGRGELDQIDKVFKLLGCPTDETWPGFSALPNAGTFRWKTDQGSKLSKKYPVGSFSGGQTFLDSNGFDLLSKLLTLDPKKRIKAGEALEHPYFREGVERQIPRFIF